MSTETRLKRLGLWHLHDQPEALSKELSRRIEVDGKARAIEVAAAEKKRAAMREAMENPTRTGEPEPPTY